jgi:hypothetical protein
MSIYLKYTGFYLFLSFFIISGCNQPEPQEPDPIRRKSPIAIAKVNHQPSDTYIKIVYGQPYKREREIFGDLVPFDEVWRTGANEATELTTTKDIIFGGEKLQAGTYSLFSIPRKDDDWTIILNKELGQWGAFDYNKSADVMRIDASVSTQKTVTEAFTIQFSEVDDDSTSIILEWDQTTVKVPVEFMEVRVI